MNVLMWEAVAAPGRLAEVVAWARALAADGLDRHEVYVSADDRVVVIAHWRDAAAAAAAELAPPPGTLARDGHAWRFEQVT